MQKDMKLWGKRVWTKMRACNSLTIYAHGEDSSKLSINQIRRSSRRGHSVSSGSAANLNMQKWQVLLTHIHIRSKRWVPSTIFWSNGEKPISFSSIVMSKATNLFGQTVSTTSSNCSVPSWRGKHSFLMVPAKRAALEQILRYSVTMFGKLTSSTPTGSAWSRSQTWGIRRQYRSSFQKIFKSKIQWIIEEKYYERFKTRQNTQKIIIH